MLESGFLLIFEMNFAESKGMKTTETIQSSDNTACIIPPVRPSDEIEPQRLLESGRAVADLAHLAKNILQVLSGCSEIIDLALQTDQLSRVQQAWRLYQPGFWRLKKLQLDLIKYTKQYPLNPQPCELNGVIDAAIRQVEPFFEKRQVTFTRRQQGPHGLVIVDGEQLRDAVVNLLVAAVDNLEDAPGQIMLETRFSESSRSVHITVSDDGPRLDAAMCCDLLRPCERCRNMLGTGLEIPLAKHVVEAHGGVLAVNCSATAERGNMFDVRLSMKD